MKRDWKKEDGEVYLPGAKPTTFRLAPMRYFLVSGAGSPADRPFQEAVEMAYTISYALKMFTKKNPEPDGWYDYAVFPLEASWSIAAGAAAGDKDSYTYSVMIRQPEFLDAALADCVRSLAGKKKPALPWRRLEFGEYDEGECLQALHIGPYDDEERTFAVMRAFLAGNGLRRRGEGHKEIYLNDPRRTPPEKLKTALRYWVEKDGDASAGATPAMRRLHG